jgi:hypothetical protein
MGSVKSVLKNFKCKSSCSYDGELDQNIHEINFNDLELKPRDIELLNKICKKSCKYKIKTEC